MLGIEVQHATPHRGQSKPIERWFRTVCEQFSVRWPTYTGKDTASKPDVLSARLKAGSAPKLDEFIHAFEEYVRAFNARTGHEGDSMDGRSPDEVWASCLRTRRAVDDSLLDFVKMVRVQVTVNQNAIVRLPGFDVSYGRGERELIDRIRQKVWLAYNPENLSEGVLLLDDDGSAICRLMHRDKLPWNADSEMLKEAKREQRANMKAAREFQKRRPRMVMSVPELARLADAENVEQERERLRATGTDQIAAQAPIELVKTPIVQSLAAISQAMNPSQPTRIDAESLRAAFTQTANTPVDEPASTFSILGRALSREVSRD